MVFEAMKGDIVNTCTFKWVRNETIGQKLVHAIENLNHSIR